MMKTIKELEADKPIGMGQWYYINALKDVLGLIDELEAQEDITNIWEELKARINGEKGEVER